MAKVNFNLKDSKAEKSLLMLIFRYNGKKLKYSTGQTIPTKFWNTNTQRIKRTNNFPQYSDINAYLDQLISHTTKIYNQYRANDRYPTITQFKDELNQKTGKTAKEENKTLFTFIDSFIVERDKSNKYATKTIAYYKVVRGILKAYATKKRKSLDFDDIDLEFYNDFLAYLHNDRKDSINYTGNIIKTIKTFLNDATEKGINSNLSFKSRYFKKPTQEVDNIYLTLDELTKIYHFNLSNNKRLDKVRDLFLIGCFTGLRFSDYSTISNENLTRIDYKGKKVQVLNITQQKTKQTVTIPLHPIVKAIYDKYDGSFPSTISNQKLNQYIKEVLQLADINESVQTTTSVAGKPITITSKKYEKVSSHTARRSFATNAYLKGIPTITIMAITGHKSSKAFLRYIRVSNEQHAVIISQSEFFKMPLRRVI